MKHQKVQFQGQDYLCIFGSALMTKEEFVNGIEGYAVFIGDDVVRYGEVIGKQSDITFLDEYEEAEPTEEAYEKVLGGVMNERNEFHKHRKVKPLLEMAVLSLAPLACVIGLTVLAIQTSLFWGILFMVGIVYSMYRVSKISVCEEDNEE